MSLENFFVIAGCLLLGLLVIGRSVRDHRRLIIATLCAVLGVGIVAGVVGLRRWHRERPRGTAPELASEVRVSTGADLRHRVTAPAKVAVVSLSFFSGTWNNVKMPVRGLTKLRVRTQGESVWVHAWEKCHPTDCDWGEAAGSAVTPSDTTADVQKVTATFQTSFTETTMTLTPAEENTLDADTQTRFTDNSGRSSYSVTYTFRH